MHPRRIAGKLLYQLWHKPVTFLKDGGPWQNSAKEVGRREMEAAAYTLPALPEFSSPPVTLHLLTGKRYWFQSAFCLWSLSIVSQRPIIPILYDDGTLEKTHIEALLHLFPKLTLMGKDECLSKVDKLLPASRYPSIRERRLKNPLFKKLLDIHVGQIGWKLQIDSDLLFFRTPNTLLEWHDSPTQPLRAEDIANAYGYPIKLLNKLSGKQIPERVNTGLLGLRSEDLDWDKMEFWCRTLIKEKGPSYFQEQALVALHLAGKECIVPDPNAYVLFPNLPEATQCNAVMHHYVSNSKKWYFSRNWRRIPSLLNQT